MSLPSAAEDHPWDATVVKVRTKAGVPQWRTQGEGIFGPMFLWLGYRDQPSPSVAVKLTSSYDAAVDLAHATRTTVSGLGQWGWLTVRLEDVVADLLEDWIEESYRNVAPKRFAAELDARARAQESR